jgi:hypothetical protein
MRPRDRRGSVSIRASPTRLALFWRSLYLSLSNVCDNMVLPVYVVVSKYVIASPSLSSLSSYI